MRIANWTAPIYNISGLSFGKAEVQSRVNNNIKPWAERKDRVVFAARFDQEKQPDFFMDIIENVKHARPDVEFAVLSGGPLRSNNQKYLDRALHLEKAGLLTIEKDLKKEAEEKGEKFDIRAHLPEETELERKKIIEETG